MKFYKHKKILFLFVLAFTISACSNGMQTVLDLVGAGAGLVEELNERCKTGEVLIDPEGNVRNVRDLNLQIPDDMAEFERFVSSCCAGNNYGVIESKQVCEYICDENDLTKHSCLNIEARFLRLFAGISDDLTDDERLGYLIEGRQTNLTYQKAQILAQIQGSNGKEIATSIIDFVHKWHGDHCTTAQKSLIGYDFTNNSFVNQNKRIRTVDEILESGCFTGCSDYTMVFTSLARNKGIPATVTETLKETYVKTALENHALPDLTEGHFYSEVFIDNEWWVVDPTQRVISNKSPENYFYINENKYVLFERGIDVWEYMGNSNDLFHAALQDRLIYP